jgi:NitT/TauT family transport system substrate-binding protein
MVARVLAASFAFVSAVWLALLPSARAEDLLKVAVAQRGQWDTAITELGERSGIFKKRGIMVEILYTQGGPEAHQAVISGSMDIACGGGIESAIGGFSKGAPVRIIGSAMIGSPDTYWFVVANSPIKSLADAAGKTISYSQNGSSSHTALLALLDQYKVEARPVSTGGHPATLTMAMTGQIDIGRGAAPFGLDLVEEGKIRVIARGPEVPTLRNQTIRVQIVNANALKERKDVMKRFMRAYRESIDWMYSNPLAVKYYAETIKQPERLVVMQRDQYNPKEALSPDKLSDLDQVMADAVEMKFLDAPLTKAQLAELFQIPPPGS